MTITNGYATLAEYKTYVVARGQASSISTDASDDAMIEDIIEAVSRYIDRETGRHFYSASETRYYTSIESDTLYIDDLSTATGFLLYTDDDGDRTYENTWASTDYDLLPLNAETDGFPFTMVETTPNGSYTFPGTKKGVKITGTFGWAAVPDDIKIVCLMIAQNLYTKRSGQQSGGTVEVTAAGVVIRPEDVPPFARTLLTRYMVI